jgi:Domain of unknown function (DUF4062)
MRVFVSSLIDGFEALRDAAASAISTLGHQPIRAEDFPASPESPQQACLAGVREADAVVLILGDRYGFVQQSGLSATHEEYREARESRPVLMFLQRDGSPEPRQLEFIREVQGWERGHYTADYGSSDELRDRVTRALHDFSLASEAAPLNESDLADRTRSLIPSGRQASRPSLFVAVAPGPVRAVIRPAQLEDADLHRFLLAEALTGTETALTPSSGTDVGVQGDTIHLTQREAGRLVTLDESGRVLVVSPASEMDRWRSGIPCIIEEDVRALIERSLRFTARVLEQVDGPGRLTHVAPIVSLVGAGFLPWRTRDEQQRSPNAASMGMGGADEVVVALTPPVRRRPALMHETSQLADDFTARLRRDLRR